MTAFTESLVKPPQPPPHARLSRVVSRDTGPADHSTGTRGQLSLYPVQMFFGHLALTL